MDKFFKGLKDDGSIEFQVELLALTAYKAIWNRDTSSNKDMALKDFTYIWGAMSKDASNPYSGILDKEERHNALVSDIYNGKFDPIANGDKVIIDAMTLYRERNPKNGFEENAEFLHEQIESLRTAIRNIDKTAVDGKGSLLLKPVEFAKATTEISKMVKEYEEMIRLGRERRNEDSNTIRGGGSVGMFENPESISYM